MYERGRSEGSRRLRRLYVRNVNKYVRERDLEKLFSRLGRVTNCLIRQDYAFIDYEDPRDAADAIKEYNGYKLEGDRIGVEYARKGPPAPHRMHGGSVERCYNCGDPGHIARECSIPTGRGDRAMRFDENRCFDCGDTGHLARDCPEKRNGRRSSRDRGRSRSPRRLRHPSRSRTPPRRERNRNGSRSPRRSSRSSKRESDEERDRRY